MLKTASAAASGEQKSRKIFISDFRALAEPADFTILDQKE
jgi:hypothetical protein